MHYQGFKIVGPKVVEFWTSLLSLGTWSGGKNLIFIRVDTIVLDEIDVLEKVARGIEMLLTHLL